MIRLCIVAAYTSVRAGLHSLLADASDIQIVGEVSGSAELERVLASSHPEVVLFDYNETDSEYLMDVVEEAQTGLVVMGEARDGFLQLADQSFTGWAYLLKEADGQEIAGAIRAAHAGLVAIDRSLVSLWMNSSPHTTRIEEPSAGEVLTSREHEVLQLMAQGLPNKVIAVRLSISLHTVKFHVASILSKLGAASRTEAVTLGARRGHITL